MKNMSMKPSLLLACVAMLSLVAPGALFCAEPPPLTIAVFDFDSRDGGASDLGAKVSALLTATLSAEPNLITVEREELAKVLSEQELALSGTVSSETAAKIGQLTGAKIIVTGRVFKAEKDTFLVAKIISVETSRVYGEMVKGGGAATDFTSDLARKIAKTVSDKGETLLAKVETREHRIARLKEQLKDTKLPSVYVKIPEQHYGAPTRDPAAETELMKMLQEVGFTLAENEAKADVAISGEAFSAAAGRKGNLHICKARVEVKAIKSKTGEILAVDREVGAAVDLAEQTAGKTALQQTAETLASRLLPKLLK